MQSMKRIEGILSADPSPGAPYVLRPHERVLEVRPGVALEVERLVEVERDDLVAAHLEQEIAQRSDRDRARMDRPDLAGRVVIQSTIGPDGRVQSASASSSIDGGARLQGCVLSAWRSWTFPAPAGGIPANVSKTFNFE